MRTQVGNATFTLYGFRSGRTVCLRLVATGIRDTGPSMGCVSTDILRTSRDPVIPVIGDLGFGYPTQAIATFGFAADRLRKLELVSDEGRSEAILGDGAFLDLIRPASKWTQVREAEATDRSGSRSTVPIVVNVAGEPPVLTRLAARGPSKVERRVRRRALSLQSMVSSGAGFQFTNIVVRTSRDVARVELFLATGERFQLRHGRYNSTFYAHAQLAKFPARLVAYDSKGLVIGVLTLSRSRSFRGVPGPIPPHIVFDRRTFAGEIVVKAGPYRDGGTCYVLDTSRTSFLARQSHRFAHCVGPIGPDAVELIESFVSRGEYLFGRVGEDVASLEFRTSNGSRLVVRPLQRFFVVATRDHVVKWIGRDATGAIVARSSWSR